ncbi:hypothetical protein EJB05_36385, partial [Eragrostis curvula]
MDDAGEEGGQMTYAQVEQHFNSLEGPSAQERIDCIIPLLLSLLPAPFVPAPEVEADDDDRISLTSSDSEVADAGEGHGTLVEAAPGDGEDHISRLPDLLLTDIIHRLPTKDAGRTAALSTHWRRVWAASPLLVDDAHLGDGGPKDIPIVRAVSRCVAAHPGPIGGVRITRVSFVAHEYALRRLVATLADKDVKDLILFNRPWPLDMPLPDDIFRCASLDRLYLGVWHFPKTTAACSPAFPDLRELGLFHCIVPDREFDAMLAHCPKLEVLSIVMSYGAPSRLCLASRSLQVAVDWMSMFEEVVVQDAPCLKRLLFDFQTIDNRRTIRIVRAPKLEVLGFLDLNMHDLEIGGTVIRAGVNVSAGAMVPSLKILAVTVQFACDREAKMLPTLLKCFPHLETLHILSVPSESPDNVHDMRFWETRGACECLEFWGTRGACECLESHLKTVVLNGSGSQMHEIGFLRYILREGKALKTVGLVCKDEKARNFRVSGGTNSQAFFRMVTPRWSFQTAIDLSLDDPFYLVPAEA